MTNLNITTDLHLQLKKHLGANSNFAFLMYQFFYKNDAGIEALKVLKEKYLNQAVINLEDKDLTIAASMREGQRKMLLEIIFYCDMVEKIITERTNI